MADAVIPTVEISGVLNITASETGAGGGGGGTSDLVDNIRNRTLIFVRNASGAPRTVTITPQQTPTRPENPDHTFPAEATPNLVKVIADGAFACFWGIPSSYNDVNGKVHLSYDNAAGLTIAAVIINIV